MEVEHAKAHCGKSAGHTGFRAVSTCKHGAVLLEMILFIGLAPAAERAREVDGHIYDNRYQ